MSQQKCYYSFSFTSFHQSFTQNCPLIPSFLFSPPFIPSLLAPTYPSFPSPPFNLRSPHSFPPQIPSFSPSFPTIPCFFHPLSSFHPLRHQFTHSVILLFSSFRLNFFHPFIPRPPLPLTLLVSDLAQFFFVLSSFPFILSSFYASFLSLSSHCLIVPFSFCQTPTLSLCYLLFIPSLMSISTYIFSLSYFSPCALLFNSSSPHFFRPLILLTPVLLSSPHALTLLSIRL